MRLSRNLAGASSALSSRSNLPTHRKQPAPSGCSLAARGLSRRASGWDFLDIWAGACLRRGRKVNGRWTEGGQRTPVSMSSSKRSPRPGPTAVQRVLSGFSAGSQKVLRRCLICRLAANGSTRTRFRPAPAKRLSWAAAIAPTATRVELEVSVQFPNLEGCRER